jgi:hypothetical protein
MQVRKCVTAVAAIIAVATVSTAAMADDYPAMVQTMFHYNDAKGHTVNGCRDYAVNVYTMVKARDISVQDNSIWAVMDSGEHAYTVAVWCDVQPNSAGLVLTVAGVEYEAAKKAVDTIVDAWTGKNDPKPSVPDVTATAKKKKGHNI